MFVSKPPDTTGENSTKAWPPIRRGSPGWKNLASLCPAPLQIGLVIVALAWGLALVRGPLTIDIGAANHLDMLYLTPGEDGFFAAETREPSAEFPEADTTYRWAGRNARLKLPWPLDAVPLQVYARLNAPRPGVPASDPGATVKVRDRLEWSEQELGTLEVNGPYQGNYYRLDAPVHLRPNLASYELWFQTDNAYQPGNGDVRGLALIFFSLRLEPNYEEFGWQGWLATLARPVLLALIAFCCWGIARRVLPARLSRRGPLLIEAGAGGLLLLSIVMWPQAAEPLYASWGFILPLTWLLLTLAEIFRRRATAQPAAFIYAAMLFPLLPLAQFAFGRLNLYSLNPAAVTTGVFVGAFFYAGAIYISSGPDNPRAFERAFVRAMLLATLVSFGYHHFHVFQTNQFRGADFKVYYAAMQNFETKGVLYDLEAIANQPGQAARMPPGFTFLLWPLVRVFGPDVNSALLVWRLFNELLLIPCLLLLTRVFGGEQNGIRRTPAVWFLALNFGQIAESLGYGQWNIFVLLSLALMALWVKEDRPERAGAMLALPVALKLYPVVSGLYFGFAGKKKFGPALAGVLAGGAVVALLAGITVGFNQLWFYATRVVGGINRPEVDISNQSLWGFWSRLALPRVMADYKEPVPGWVNLVSYACVIGLVGLSILGLWRSRTVKGDIRQLKLGMLALTAILIPPFVWFHYIVPCLVAVLALLVVLTRPRAQAEERPTWQLVGFGVAYAVLAYGGRNDFFFTDAVGLARLASSYRFLAALWLWGLSLWLIWQTSHTPEPEVDMAIDIEKVDKGPDLPAPARGNIKQAV